jgi:hypothetical protein
VEQSHLGIDACDCERFLERRLERLGSIDRSALRVAEHALVVALELRASTVLPERFGQRR